MLKLTIAEVHKTLDRMEYQIKQSEKVMQPSAKDFFIGEYEKGLLDITPFIGDAEIVLIKLMSDDPLQLIEYTRAFLQCRPGAGLN